MNLIPMIYFINNIAYYTVPKIQYKALSITHNIPLKKDFEAYWKIDNFLEHNFGYTKILKQSIENLEELKSNLENTKIKFIPTINHISVCCDLIESSFVGNSKLNLLRIISKSTLDKKNNSINFNPLIFVPLRKQLIDSINICLLDENKNYLLLDKELTTVVLLLRPIEHI